MFFPACLLLAWLFRCVRLGTRLLGLWYSCVVSQSLVRGRHMVDY